MANPSAPREGDDLTGAKHGYGVHDDGAEAEAALVRIVNADVAQGETTPSGALSVASKVLHDAADVADEGPIKIGGVADSTRPAAVADGDRVAAAYGLQGDAHVSELPRTSGGLSWFSKISTAAELEELVKGSPGQVYAIQCYSIDATPVYVRIYNHVDAPAVGDAADIVWRGMIPPNSGFVLTFPTGLACSAGIGVRATTGIADNDEGALSASEVLVNVQFA